jgi:AbrB family looped-hinge helix DNA binding protein
MPTATLSSKGQITIPQEVRQRLGLKTGDRVEFMYQPDGNVAIKTKKIPFERLRGIAKTNRRKPATLREIDEGIATAIGQRYLRAVRRSGAAK